MPITLPGAASLALLPLLEEPPRPARVLGGWPGAAHLGTASGEVVTVVGPGGLRLPNAVVVPSPWEPPAGGEVLVGGGGLAAGASWRVRVVRTWDPAPRLGPVDASRLPSRLEGLQAGLVAAGRHPWTSFPASLVAALARRDLGGAVAAAQPLLGLGPGLTPAGDDMLVGMLAAVRHLAADGDVAGAWGSEIAARAGEGTTSLSATLLRLASRGQILPQVGQVLQALATGSGLRRALHGLLAVGHSSGPEMAWGLLWGGLASVGRAGEVP